MLTVQSVLSCIIAFGLLAKCRTSHDEFCEHEFICSLELQKQTKFTESFSTFDRYYTCKHSIYRPVWQENMHKLAQVFAKKHQLRHSRRLQFVPTFIYDAIFGNIFVLSIQFIIYIIIIFVNIRRHFEFC